MAKRDTDKPAAIKPQFADVKLGNLLFDTQNPRLTYGKQAHSEPEMVSILWHEMAVDEIADSIAANGFFKEEPLVVIPKQAGHTDPETDKFIVVEGNRRLAAVRLLVDEQLRNIVGAKALPALSQSVRQDLVKLPTAIYPKREDVWAFLGFRHINGPKPWDALSKAQFVAKIFENQKVPLDRIAQQIGDRNVTVKRLYRGYTLLRQAESEGDFDTKDAAANRFYFSHLYTAADQAEFQHFLGIDAESSLKPDPVSKRKLRELSDLMVWVYGSRAKKKEPLVQTQFPDLNTLRETLRSAEGIAALRAGYSLERSHEIAIGDPQRFREAMISARESLVQANGTIVNGYQGESDLLAVADDVLKLAGRVVEEVRKVHSTKSGKVRA
jgi:hypothetical protein